ncbi:hypothetical protein [Clostridium sp. C8-1-8]|uniref:hypothetical protein n=1 Tax=Clostridium sp. C8-1-8 TaxID=2698831 RepID=UPI00136B5B54|nr:hypothetical protein [Clostridium sp. C8-1-8]
MNQFIKNKIVQDFKKKHGFTNNIDKNESGVYLIYSCSTDFCYVGETKNPFKERYPKHKYHLRLGNHSNIKLQEIYNEYGEDDLEFIPIYICAEFMNKYTESAYIENYGLKTINNRGSITRFEWQRINEKERIMLNGIPDMYRIIIEEHKKWKCIGKEKILIVKFEEYLNNAMKFGMEIKSKEEFRWIEECESKEIFDFLNEYNHEYDNFIKMPLDYIGLSILNDILGKEKRKNIFDRNKLRHERDIESDDLIYNIYKRIRTENNFLAHYVNAYLGYSNNQESGVLKVKIFSNRLTCIMDVVYYYVLILIMEAVEGNTFLQI